MRVEGERVRGWRKKCEGGGRKSVRMLKECEGPSGEDVTVRGL